MSETLVNGKASLFSKMARVMARLGRIEKRGHNTRFNYDFVSSDDVADAVREALAAENLAFFASQGDMIEKKISWGQGEANYYIIDFNYTFADGDSGETYTCHWRGEAIDNQDKTIAKAATSAEKYFLLKTFIVSTGDDPDPDDDGTQRKQPNQQQGNQKNGNGNGHNKPNPPAAEISPELTHALQFQTGDKKYLRDLNIDELKANREKALAVPEEKRGPAWTKAFEAVEMVMKFRESQPA